MTTRARHKAMMSWFPRGALILTVVLAPVIDCHVVSGTSRGAAQVEAADGADPVAAVEVALDAAVRP